ncbi:MAG: DEAD/DEAH box helicase [Desulfobacterales bacterium]|nr:DEAD/DEAH box helicase [Desulfobacterales bacterium]
MSFKKYSFNPRIAAGITAAGYTTPTPIQTQAISKIMQGSDLIGLAQTGTGKTAAFVLPILQRLLGGKRGTLRALIVAPTRELVEQIHEVIEALGAQTGLHSVTVYGGVGIQPQIQKLRQADIVVACPGRLLDHIGRRTINLSRLEVLVLDEADQMFDMGFLPDIRRILKHLPRAGYQTLLFSATMPAPIRRLTADILHHPVRVEVGNDAPAHTVSHAFYPVAKHLKTALLLKLLGNTNTGAVLVFTRTKHKARQLGGKLAKVGYRSASLQGNLSQTRRRDAMNGFKSGKYQVLVATDIAARGIDVSNVSHVINYDVPSTAEAYIHRIGRTGRAECSGEAFTLITGEDKQMVRAINGAVGTPVEHRTLEDFNYQVPAAVKTQSGRRGRQQWSGGRARSPRKRRDAKGAFAMLSPRKTKPESRR